MKKSILFLLSLIVAASASAQEIIPLYDGAAPGTTGTDIETTLTENGEKTIRYVSVPTLKLYLPEADKATGAAMVVCPGGAFLSLAWEKEGEDMAEWLAERGIAAGVLKYRLIKLGDTPEACNQRMGEVFRHLFDPNEPNTLDLGLGEETLKFVNQAYDDARRAIVLMREHAQQWGIDPQRVGLMGFSAGAMISAEVAVNHSPEEKPNFVALIYGAWLPNVKGEERPLAAPDDAAPMFICSPEFDMFEPDDILMVYKEWRSKKIPTELHFFPFCQHGFGKKEVGKGVDIWPQLLYNFMKDVEFVK